MLIYRAGGRLRLRRAMWDPALRRYEVTFDRGAVAWGFGASRSFTWAAIKAIAETYRSAWRNRHVGRFRIGSR